MKKIVMLSAVVFAFVMTANLAFAWDFGGNNNNNCGNCQQQQKCPCPETSMENITVTNSSTATSGSIKIDKVTASKINALTGTAYAEIYGSATVNVGGVGKVTVKNVNASNMSSAVSGNIDITNVLTANNNVRSRCSRPTMTMPTEINAQTGAAQSVNAGIFMLGSTIANASN